MQIGSENSSTSLNIDGICWPKGPSCPLAVREAKDKAKSAASAPEQNKEKIKIKELKGGGGQEREAQDKMGSCQDCDSP